MTRPGISDDDLGRLVERVREATGALMQGDVRRYLALVNHAPDYRGDGDLELDKRYVSGELAVLVGVERQHGPVAGLPDQDWPLRVTLVSRREGSDWRLVHRHADALVHPISMEQLSLLARGSVEPGG